MIGEGLEFRADQEPHTRGAEQCSRCGRPEGPTCCSEPPRRRGQIALEVLGTPAPKGSGRAILIAGKARHVPSGSNANRDALKSWETLVREQAQRAHADPAGPAFVDRPLAVVLEFRMVRPGGHWAKRGGLKPSAPIAPATKPDADKLARATLDALHGTIFDDDSRIVELTVRKRYAQPGNEGARITVEIWSAAS